MFSLTKWRIKWILNIINNKYYSLALLKHNYQGWATEGLIFSYYHSQSKVITIIGSFYQLSLDLPPQMWIIIKPICGYNTLAF